LQPQIRSADARGVVDSLSIGIVTRLWTHRWRWARHRCLPRRHRGSMKRFDRPLKHDPSSLAMPKTAALGAIRWSSDSSARVRAVTLNCASA
jgi:hypothetical protein